MFNYVEAPYADGRKCSMIMNTNQKTNQFKFSKLTHYISKYLPLYFTKHHPLNYSATEALTIHILSKILKSVPKN